MATKIDPKVPPHDLQAEESVLAAILIDKDAIQGFLKFWFQSFHSAANRAIYQAMLIYATIVSQLTSLPLKINSKT